MERRLGFAPSEQVGHLFCSKHAALNLVPLHRIELQTPDYKTSVIPFNYKGKNLSCLPNTGTPYRCAGLKLRLQFPQELLAVIPTVRFYYTDYICFCQAYFMVYLVPQERLELSRTRHRILRPACLPIPPSGQFWCRLLESNQLPRFFRPVQ